MGATPNDPPAGGSPEVSGYGDVRAAGASSAGPPAPTGFTDSVRTCLSKYADFSGRASRAEFWWFFLFVILVWGVVLPVVAVILLATVGGDSGAAAAVIIVLLVLAWLGLFVPYLAVAARRLHDTDKSAALLLLLLVPFGGLVVLVLCALDGTPGPNRYGPPPAG